MDSIKHNYKAVIFDMDGTVLNTARDLADAMNYALQQTGHRHDYTEEDTKLFFGSGIRVAICRALALEAGLERKQLLQIESPDAFAGKKMPTNPAEQDKILTVYRPYYEQHCNDHTAPYPGIPELLQTLQNAGVQTAVVSNKPDPAVQILAKEQFPGGFAFAAGEQPGVRRKPAPDLVLQTLRAMQIRPEKALYVGDSEIDIQTARNAGMDCAAVSWGFRSRDYLAQKSPEYLVDTCEELLACISQ